jgi:hypothetical protein
MADDHGFFHADPNIVRGAVMPFRENLATISRSLAKLSEVGWVEISDHPEQGAIGKIAKWRSHQKVDHPKDSALACYFSRENLATVSREPRENLALEGKGMEGSGGEGGATTPVGIPLAPSLAEIVEFGSMHGVTEKSCRRFVEWHNKNEAWVRCGKLIDWPKKLVSWAVTDRENGTVKSEITDNRPQWLKEGYCP